MLKNCIIFENEKEVFDLKGVEENQLVYKSDHYKSGGLSISTGTYNAIDGKYANIYISGVYNKPADVTCYGVIYKMNNVEFFRYSKIYASFFSSEFKIIDDLKTMSTIAELDTLISVICDCYYYRTLKAVIFYNNDETLQWLSGQLFTDNPILSKIRNRVLIDAEILGLEFSKAMSSNQTYNNELAKQMIEKVVIPKEYIF